jgi:hypothetical protein
MARFIVRLTVPLLFGSLCVLWTLVSSAQEKKLTAREIFYAAATSPEPLPAKTTQAAKPKPRPPTAPKRRQSAESPGLPPSSENLKIVQAGYTAARPLGLRYSILKTGGGQAVEVDPDTVFHAGDRIRLSIEVNDTSYLYVVNRGSSGAWKVLFPSPEIAGGSNLVESGRRYEIPAGYVFTFDEQPGVEKLFLIVSRRPESDLEKLIYSLTQRPAGGVAPATERKEPKMLLASNIQPIGDGLIGRLRNSYARDLVIEKVDQDTPGPKKETAVYAVSSSGGPDAHVVADVSLNHQ